MLGRALLVVLAASLTAGERVAVTPPESITVAELREDVSFLASPALAGRRSGQPGYRIAAEYAAKRFREAGLKPVYNDEQGADSFLQPVPFIRYHFGSGNNLTFKRRGEELILPHGGKNYLLANPGKAPVEIPPGPPVFIGYGIHATEYGWDDYCGLEIAGKLVILMDGVPTDSEGKRLPESVRRQYAHRVKGPQMKLNAIAARRAAGVIIVPPRQVVNAWSDFEAYQRRADFVAAERYSEEEPPDFLPVLMAHADLIKRMFSGRGYDPLSRKGNYRTFVLDDIELTLKIDVTRELFTAYNVVGMAPGADPNLRGQYLTASAHLDHLGTDGGKVFPGANDDASGCAAVLEVARAVALKPTRRSVIFVLFAGEEAGRLGSLHFINHPPVEKSQIRVNINLEQVGRRNPQLPGFWVVGSEGLAPSVYSAARKAGTAVQFEPAESRMGAFRMSDNYSFYAKDIPALLISCGGFPEQHSPDDKAELIDFEHLRRASLLTYALVMELGSR